MSNEKDDNELSFVTADVKTCPHGFVFEMACIICVSEKLISRIEKLENLIHNLYKTSITLGELKELVTEKLEQNKFECSHEWGEKSMDYDTKGQMVFDSRCSKCFLLSSEQKE